MHTSLSSGFPHRRWTIPAVTALGATAILMAASSAFGIATAQDVVSVAAPEPVNQIRQLSEPDSASGRVAINGTAASTPSRVCERGAKWLRLRFTELTLRDGDSVTVTGTAGGSFTFTGRHWPGKAFHTRAFEGQCVQISPHLSDPASSYAIDAYQSGTQPLSQATVTVAAVGDVCGSSCDQTAPLVEAMNPQALILAGDNAYDSGTLSEYRNNYDPYYGQFKSITYPSPGNHEYNTSGASGYFDYFGARAGERGKGYYSFDVGDWHFIALNSNISRSSSSAQVSWLRNDLAANTKPCTAAYWHHPRFSRGSHGDDTSVTPFYSALYDAGADLIVVGHDHNYQRFAPSRPDGTRDDANGVRQLLIGTGGRGFYSFDQSSDAEIEASNDNTFGVGKLTLTATGYTAEFVPVAGRTFTDRVTGTCHNASPGGVTVANPGNQSSTVGTAVTLDNSATGGTTPYTWSATGLPAGLSINSSTGRITGTPTTAGTTNVTVTATDSSSPAKSGSASFSWTVNNAPTPSCNGTNGNDVSIPDNTTVESSITISGCSGNASATATVEVHIVHTYIGDLVVSLVAPDGSIYTLHNRSGGSANDINQTYTVNLSSEVANGTWKLRVQDAATYDTGRIDTWTLNLGGGGTPPCSGTNGNDVSIPDNTTVESSIAITGCSGNASSSSRAEVHIVHTYIGDLIVTLVAPDGSSYVLHNRSGGSANDINQTYTVNLSSETRNGTWKLRVQDAASQDIGRIDTWTLTL